VFRRAFERRYGISPGLYRRHFAAAQLTSSGKPMSENI